MIRATIVFQGSAVGAESKDVFAAFGNAAVLLPAEFKISKAELSNIRNALETSPLPFSDVFHLCESSRLVGIRAEIVE